MKKIARNTNYRSRLYRLLMLGMVGIAAHPSLGYAGEQAAAPATAGRLYPLDAVRLLESPFSAAASANRTYLLALDADRLLAPFFREAGLQPKKPPYPNWESQGLDGHTGGRGERDRRGRYVAHGVELDE